MEQITIIFGDFAHKKSFWIGKRLLVLWWQNIVSSRCLLAVFENLNTMKSPLLLHSVLFSLFFEPVWEWKTEMIIVPYLLTSRDAFVAGKWNGVKSHSKIDDTWNCKSCDKKSKSID